MMNQHIACANDPQTRLLYPVSIVVILKHANSKLFVQRSDAFERVSAEGHAEHCKHVYVSYLAVLIPCMELREFFHLGPGFVWHIYFCFVSHKICDWPDQANFRVVEVSEQTA